MGEGLSGIAGSPQAVSDSDSETGTMTPHQVSVLLQWSYKPPSSLIVMNESGSQSDWGDKSVGAKAWNPL